MDDDETTTVGEIVSRILSSGEIKELKENQDLKQEIKELNQELELNQDLKEVKEKQVNELNQELKESEIVSSDDDEDTQSLLSLSTTSSEETTTLVDSAVVDSEEEEEDNTEIVKTKNEIVEEVVELFDIRSIPKDATYLKIGVIQSVIHSTTVLVQSISSGEIQVLDANSVLFIENGGLIGRVVDVFGPVVQPFYSVRMQHPERASDFKIGNDVFYIPDLAKITLTEPLKAIKGSDASNLFDEEIDEKDMEFSDDEKEMQFKRKKTEKTRGNKKPRREEYHFEEKIVRNRDTRQNRGDNRSTRIQQSMSVQQQQPQSNQQMANAMTMDPMQLMAQLQAAQYQLQLQQYHQNFQPGLPIMPVMNQQAYMGNIYPYHPPPITPLWMNNPIQVNQPVNLQPAPQKESVVDKAPDQEVLPQKPIDEAQNQQQINQLSGLLNQLRNPNRSNDLATKLLKSLKQ